MRENAKKKWEEIKKMLLPSEFVQFSVVVYLFALPLRTTFNCGAHSQNSCCCCDRKNAKKRKRIFSENIKAIFYISTEQCELSVKALFLIFVYFHFLSLHFLCRNSVGVRSRSMSRIANNLAAALALVFFFTAFIPPGKCVVDLKSLRMCWSVPREHTEYCMEIRKSK